MQIEEQLKIIEDLVKKLNDRLAVPYIWEKTKDPFWALIATVLSIRTREEQTIRASLNLYNKYKDYKNLAKAPIEEIEDLIKNVGLYKQKAKWIKTIAQRWDYNKKCDESFIRNLPGVGRKVGNVYLNLVCNKPYIAVDVHVHRIANRLGWVKTKTPEETEKQLYKIIPKEYWPKLNHMLVLFGRNICLPSKPKCDICPLDCPYKYNKNKP